MSNMKTALDKLAVEGLVATVRHDNLTIYNYSDKTVWDRLWTPETLAARGLVLADDGRIVARPWPKFFNLGECGWEADKLPAETPELADKYDGSLVICFWHAGAWRCITRGSWENPQTRAAQEWVDKNRAGFDRDYTYLFELVAPWNRIVLPYERFDMILLGRVHTESGVDTSYADAADHAEDLGITPVRFTSRPLASLNMADPSVTDAEGYVARYSNGVRVKLKYAEYLRLHKLMTGLSVLAIWEGLAAGKDEPPAGVPDEFVTWWNLHRNTIVGDYDMIDRQAKRVFESVPAGLNRKECAAIFVRDPALAPVLFSMLDGKDYSQAIWKRVRPVAGARSFMEAKPEQMTMLDGGKA